MQPTNLLTGNRFVKIRIGKVTTPIVLFFLLFALTSCISPLMTASYYGKMDKVKQLLADGADLNKGNPLYQSIFKNNIDITKLLIEKGADVNKGSQSGKPGEYKPIHIAVENGYVDMVKLLIDNGATLNTVDPQGRTPMKIAEDKGNNLIVRMLKEADNAKYNQMYANNEPIVKPLNGKNTEMPILPDVDTNIPVTNIAKSNTYALIIGNEDYNSFQPDLSSEANVDYAANDSKIFKEYCVKTLGIPEKQVKLIVNATTGQMRQGLVWISNLAKLENGNAELIFYYSGHGLPDEQTKEAYLIPVDVSGSNVTLGIKLSEVYDRLNEFASKKVLVFLDACFSGGARNKGLIVLKGVKVRPKESRVNGNMVVLSSSTGEESSGVYKEKQHGFMTYFLLKKMQESKGNITYKELTDYVVEQVSKESALISKIQTPQVIISPNIYNIWSDWRIK